jgi:L-lactate dehydrogenase complex protein LldF
VLTPALVGIKDSAHLPNASTFCGRCEEVCPVKIPLPMLMRHWRETEHAVDASPRIAHLLLMAWAFCAKRPRLYHALARLVIAALGFLGASRGAFRSLPFARGWTRHRDFPAPHGRTFHHLWAETRQELPP